MTATTMRPSNETHRLPRVDLEEARPELCPHCGMMIAPESMEVHRLAEEFVLQRIREEHPEWVEEDGDCPKCLVFYEAL